MLFGLVGHCFSRGAEPVGWLTGIAAITAVLAKLIDDN